MYRDFGGYMQGLLGLEGSPNNLVKNSTKIIFDLKSKRTNDIMAIPLTQIMTGKFYLIKYNYNGNKWWCPVLFLPPPVNVNSFPVEYYIYNNHKNIIFAVNIEYLTFQYKVNFFSLFFDKVYGKMDLEAFRDKKIMSQKKIPLTFEMMYTALKTNGKKQLAITAYDLNKIEEVYLMSLNIIPRFLFMSTIGVNSGNLKKMCLEMDEIKEKKKIIILMEQFQKLLESYDATSEEFHKNLKRLESQLKLFED